MSKPRAIEGDEKDLPLRDDTISQVTVQRPDKMRVITPGDGPPTEFYYDGKSMIA